MHMYTLNSEMLPWLLAWLTLAKGQKVKVDDPLPTTLGLPLGWLLKVRTDLNQYTAIIKDKLLISRILIIISRTLYFITNLLVFSLVYLSYPWQLWQSYT